ncbi:MAG: SDR family NAD(P)-dependent oxidoreductase [Planctomycetota bacterium]|jgi:NAD(P)-dependent dehydrogenase (short-subunit alcohol dehydrogenase family)
MTRAYEGRHVVVSGGTGALGTAVVGRLLEAGAVCHVTYLVDEELEGFPFPKEVELRCLDCTSPEQVEEFFALLGALDASIHTVGGFDMAPIADISFDDFQRMFSINTLTCFLCCREAVKKMRPFRGTGYCGRIVNVAARPAVVPTGGMIAYSTSKAAVASLTRCLAEEVKAEGILVNAVAPSIMDTPANRAAIPDGDYDRWPKVEQVAETIVYLASPANAITSGALVPVYGQV